MIARPLTAGGAAGGLIDGFYFSVSRQQMAAGFYGIFDVGRGEQCSGNFLFQERAVTELPSADLDEAIVLRRKTLGAEKLFQQKDKTRVSGIYAESLPSETLNVAVSRGSDQAQQTAVQAHEKK